MQFSLKKHGNAQKIGKSAFSGSRILAAERSESTFDLLVELAWGLPAGLRLRLVLLGAVKVCSPDQLSC